MIAGFYWLIDGELAGCARPGARGQRFRSGSVPDPDPDPDPAEGLDALERDLAWLRLQGIGAVLSLTERPLAAEALARHGLVALHLPVPDLHAPTPPQLMQALGFIDRQRAAGRAVVAHCLMGQGRTGTVLAAYRIRAGTGVDAALRELRAVCPGAVENAEQVQALHRFAARRDWIL